MSLTVIDLFSGAGGMSLGLEKAEYQHVPLNDLDKDCVKTLKLNRSAWNVLQQDIRTVAFTPYKDIDLLVGGFPCQPFSHAGRALGFEDTRGTLFFETARAIKETQPRMFLLENVRGLETHDKGKTLITILKVLKELGYETYHNLLNASDYGVPQRRERIFIVGCREGLNLQFEWPEKRLPAKTLRDALEVCPVSLGQSYSEYKKSILQLVPEDGNWKSLPVEIQKSYLGNMYYSTGGKTGIAKRLSWDEPSKTLLCSPSQKQTDRCHPVETRPLTIREYARIQTFPDAWEFCGSISSQYKQIGNAVPVELAYVLESQIKIALGKLI